MTDQFYECHNKTCVNPYKTRVKSQKIACGLFFHFCITHFNCGKVDLSSNGKT